MLHLQSGIHFQKVKIHIGVGNKLYSTGRLIIYSSGQRTTLLTHFLSRRLIQKWRGCLFNHLLVTALNRALTLTQINHIAMAVGHHLNFNMSRLLNIFFNKDSRVAKTGTGFVSGTLKTVAALIFVHRHAHAFTSATGGRFKHHRITNTGTDFHCVLGIANHVGVTGNAVHPRFLSNQF